MIKVYRIGVFSLGKFLGVLYAILGLLSGLLIAFLNLLGIALTRQDWSSSSSAYGSIIGIVTGIGAVICYPILYGAMGFIGGIIMAFFSNLALKFCGGLEIEAAGFSLQPAPPREPPSNITPVSPLPE